MRAGIFARVMSKQNVRLFASASISEWHRECRPLRGSNITTMMQSFRSSMFLQVDVLSLVQVNWEKKPFRESDIGVERTMSRSMQFIVASFVPALCGNLACAESAGFNRLADKPAPRTDRNSQIAHEQLLKKARKGGIDI